MKGEMDESSDRIPERVSSDGGNVMSYFTWTGNQWVDAGMVNGPQS
jgi:hypothetical protein